MANYSVPRSTKDIADALSLEAGHLKTGVEMIYDAIGIDQTDADSVSRAIDRMYFLVESLAGLQGRLQTLSDSAVDISRAERAAA